MIIGREEKEMTAKEALDRIIDKCDLLIDGQIISKELLMQHLC